MQRLAGWDWFLPPVKNRTRSSGSLLVFLGGGGLNYGFQHKKQTVENQDNCSLWGTNSEEKVTDQWASGSCGLGNKFCFPLLRRLYKAVVVVFHTVTLSPSHTVSLSLPISLCRANTSWSRTCSARSTSSAPAVATGPQTSVKSAAPTRCSGWASPASMASGCSSRSCRHKDTRSLNHPKNICILSQ